MKAGSRLEKVLAAGHFAVTAELGPPKSADVEVIRTKAGYLRGRRGRGEHHRQPDGHRAHVLHRRRACWRCRRASSR